MASDEVAGLCVAVQTLRARRDSLYRELEALQKKVVNEQAEKEALRQRLGNLLCRIHRDGGDYIEEHGWEKAEADADLIVSQLNMEHDTQQKKVDALESEVRSMNEAHDVAQRAYLSVFREYKALKVSLSLKDAVIERLLAQQKKETNERPS